MTSEYRHPVEADIGIITVMVWKGDAVKEYPLPEGIHLNTDCSKRLLMKK
ncbi:MAG: hypothetical protein HXS46_01030 [Theionarchaea archaeon]|nr:hypothetical protein [Theionarchaea archaeon]